MILDTLAAQAGTNTLSDAAEALSIGEFLSLARDLQSKLSVADNRCLAVAPTNSVQGAALVLAALDAGRPMALVAPGPESSDRAPAFAAALASHSADGLDYRELQSPEPAPDQPRDRVYVASSGTTGTPKWIVHASDRMLRNSAAAGARLALGSRHRVLIPVPIHHMFGFGAALLPSLIRGASIHLVARGTPMDIFAAERAFDPNFAYLVPSQMRSLLALRRRPRPYGHICFAGDRVTTEEAAEFEARHGPLLGLYGSSELGVAAVATPGTSAELRHSTVGHLLPGVTYCGGAGDAPPDKDVPLSLRHPDACLGIADERGQLSSPAQTCHDTGDHARFLPGGQLQILGRRDHAAKRDGLLVHFSEIEACLLAVRGVAAAVVVPAGASRRGVGLTAIYALTPNQAISAEDLRRACLESLPARAVPDRFLSLPRLPLLPSGKPDRQALTTLAARDA